MSGPRRSIVALVVAALVGGAGCRARTDPSAPRTAPLPPAEPLVYVAVGASESVGVGADRPADEAWPAVLTRIALPPDTVFVNLGIPGATVADALARELPQAVEREPGLVTVWLNVNDLVAGVSVESYEAQLGELVRALRRNGAAKVLVANTPPLDQVPVFTACRPGTGSGYRACPTLDQLRAAVAAYNAATERVVAREGAVLVDLHAAGLDHRRAGTDHLLVSGDGFHPSTAGHLAVAEAFAAALERSGGVGAPRR